MATYIIPESFAQQHGFISPDNIASVRNFSYLGKLFNKRGIHIGMIFDKQIGLNSKFQFEFDDEKITLTEEGQSMEVWEAKLNELRVEVLNPETNEYEYKLLLGYQTTGDKVQTILNCLGNAFDNATTSSAEYSDPTSYEVADDFKMFVPGGLGYEYENIDLKKLQQLKANFNGDLNGTKSLICTKDDQILQVFTGTARVCLDMTSKTGSLKSNLISLRGRGFVEPQVEELIESMLPEDGVMSITSRKNDGTYPGGIIIKITMPGVENEQIIKGTFKELYGNTIEYTGIYGSGEDAGIAGGGDNLPTYDGIEETLI